MTQKNKRLVVEIGGEVVFSQFNTEGKTGGVGTLDYEILSEVKSLLENAIAFIEMSPCTK